MSGISTTGTGQTCGTRRPHIGVCPIFLVYNAVIVSLYCVTFQYVAVVLHNFLPVYTNRSNDLIFDCIVFVIIV